MSHMPPTQTFFAPSSPGKEKMPFRADEVEQDIYRFVPENSDLRR